VQGVWCSGAGGAPGGEGGELTFVKWSLKSLDLGDVALARKEERGERVVMRLRTRGFAADDALV